VRCGRCGNENAETNRFCGMCGAALVVKTEAAAAAPKTAPVITGPSFLGLNTPGPAVDRHREAGGARDPLQPSSKNLDYLLEDEEEPKRGWGKSILIVAALALAVGFGYLHWKQGGFDWLTGSEKKPAAATADGSAAPSGSATSPGTAATSTESAAPAAPAQTPATTPAQAPQDAAPQSVTAQNIPSQNPADANAANATSQPAVSDSDKEAPPAEAVPEIKPATPKPAVRKPATVRPAPQPYDVVSEAERYVYGRGVRQDCDHGVRLLKRAAEQSDAKAMISMGALYSTGTCTPRDLPTAYRWFALALHKQPDNQVLQDDLKNLWEKMTQPERQLAIKLSQ
jgi:hypothetical protein